MTPLRIISVSELNEKRSNTLMSALGIEITGVGVDFVRATMPVDGRTHQVYGLLHGGASVALAETLGSIGAMLTVDPEQFRCVGIEINANHVGSVTSGFVTGVARPVHTGKSTQVWEIHVTAEDDRLVCISRLTVAVVPHRKA